MSPRWQRHEDSQSDADGTGDHSGEEGQSAEAACLVIRRAKVKALPLAATSGPLLRPGCMINTAGSAAAAMISARLQLTSPRRTEATATSSRRTSRRTIMNVGDEQ